MRNRPVRAFRKLSKVGGRAVYSFLVIGTSDDVEGSLLTNTFARKEVYRETIVAFSAADALALAKEEINATGIERPFQVETYGPKGGLYSRYSGWHSVIADNLQRVRAKGAGTQLFFRVPRDRHPGGSSAAFWGVSYRDSFVEGRA